MYTDLKQDVFEWFMGGEITESSQEIPQLQIFNEHKFLLTVIQNQNLNQESALLIYDFLSQIVFMDQYSDPFSMNSAIKLLQELFKLTEQTLADHWKGLLKYGCMSLTKYEVILA